MNAVVDLGVWLEPLRALLMGGAVIAVLAAIAARCTRRGAARRVIWQAAFAGFAVLFAAEVTGITAVAQDCFETFDSAVASKSDPMPDLREATSDSARQPKSVAFIPSETHENEDTSDDVEMAEPAIGAVIWWPGAIWLSGAIILAGRACLARLLLVVFRSRHGRSEDLELITLAARVAERLGYRRAFQIVETRGLESPAAFGIVRPTLALPAGFRTDFTLTQQEAMLAHELAHLAAHDPAWHFFAQMTTAVFWWHPLAWWSLAQLRAASERAADEASLAVADGPSALATCLVQLGARMARRQPFGWLSMSGNGFRSGLGRRVERLLRLDGEQWRPLGKWRLGAILILGPMLLFVASALSTAWARPTAASEGDMPMNTVWKRSLAATVLVAALGSADSPGGQQPEEPKSLGEATRTENPQTKQLEGDAAKLAAALNTLVAQREELKKKIDTKDEKELDTIKAQLRELEAKQKDLEAARMKLEEQLKATAEAKTKMEKQPPRIKVFRLKNRDPNEVSSVLTDLLPQPEPDKGGGAGMMGMMQGAMGKGMMGGGEGGGMKGGGARGGFGGGRGGFGGGGLGGFGGGQMGLGGGLGGFGGGQMGLGGGMAGFGGGMGGGMPRPNTSWRIAVDERTNSIIVRGNEADLRTIGDIVATLDSGDKKPAAKLKNLRTFKLKHADVNQVSQIVQDLDLNVRVSILLSSEMLVISGDESALKEVANLIEELDVEGKPMKEIIKPKQ
jgi:beta-lactamase regulating signal transducer with metallopeptidase domain